MDLDKLDRKILFELDINSRQSYGQIAKKIGSSKEVVAYRMKRLEKKGIIFKYLAVIDPAKAGYVLHKVMFKLENADNIEKKKIMAYLKKHPYSLWTVECDGPFDVGFMIFARSAEELDRVLTEVSNKLAKYINERIISTTVTGEYFNRKYLLKQQLKQKQTMYGKDSPKKELDKTDWKILLCLAKDARVSLTEIAKKVPIKIDAIRQRIKRMEREGVLSSYSILLDDSRMDQLHYKLLIYLNDFSKEIARSIREFCKQQPNITYLIKSLGVWDMEIDIEVESAEKYRDVVTALLKQFPHTIKRYDSLNIYKLHRYRYLPDEGIIL